MAILSELIEPLSLQQFSEQYLFKMPYAAPLKATRFKDLVSWPLLWEIFNTKHKDCWLPRHGQLPPDPALQTGMLTFDQARKGYEEGRTVLVRHAEKAHPKLKAIADDFHSIFKDPVDIQIYGTPPEEEGFDWHYDSEEVFVIQTVGEKEFRIRKNTINPYPMHMRVPKNMQFEKESPTQEIRCHLKAGDWLYIPSGWWHKARAVTPSFHMSVGVMALTGAHYLESFVPLDQMEDPMFHRRLPVRGAEGLLSLDYRKQNLQAVANALNSHLRSKVVDVNHLISYEGKIPSPLPSL